MNPPSSFVSAMRSTRSGPRKTPNCSKSSRVVGSGLNVLLSWESWPIPMRIFFVYFVCFVVTLIPGSLAVNPPVRRAHVAAGLRINPDGMGVALSAATDRMAHAPQRRHRLRIPVRPLEADLVGEPLVIQPRRVHGRADVHVEIDDVDDDVQHGVDDGAAAGAAGDEHHLAVAGYDGRRL